MGRWDYIRGASKRALVGLLIGGAALAQTTTLNVSPATLPFATPTLANYAAGYVCAGSIGISTTGTGTSHTDSLFFRASISTAIPATAGGFTKPLADFQWSTNASGCAALSGSWTAVPGSLSAPQFLFRGTTPIATRTVWFRLLLSWTVDRGGVTYQLPGIVVFVNRSATIPP